VPAADGGHQDASAVLPAEEVMSIGETG